MKQHGMTVEHKKESNEAYRKFIKIFSSICKSFFSKEEN